MSYTLAVVVLLIAAFFRFWQLETLPPGLNNEEIIDIRLTETIRGGEISILRDLNGVSRETLYHTALTLTTSVSGRGLIGYRILSVWLGMITLAVTYTLGVRIFGPLAGLCAMALLTVSMWPALLSRLVLHETVVPILVTAVLLALARAFPVYRIERSETASTGAFAALGGLMGISVYAHQLGLIIILTAMLYIAYIVYFHRNLIRGRLSFVGFSILVLIIIVTPYLIFTIRQPEMAAAGRLFGAVESHLRSIGSGLVGIMFRGDNNPVHNLPGRPLFDLVSGFFILTGLLVTIRYWRYPRFALPLFAAITILPTALLATNSPNFVAFAGLLPVLALFFGLGIATLYNSIPAKRHWLAFIGLGILFAGNIIWTGNDLFNAWPANEEVQIAYHQDQAQLAYYLDRTAASIPSVICDPLWQETREREELTRTQLMRLMMNRKDAPLRFADCNTSLIFANGGAEEQVIFSNPRDLDTIHSYIRDWLQGGGTFLYDEVDLPPNAVIVMDIVDELADSLGVFTTLSPVKYSPELGLPANENTTFPPVRLGGNITFLGYEPDTTLEYHPGDRVPVITYWRVEGVIPPDLILFTHVLIDPVNIASNRDVISVNPRQLEDRDVFVQITYVSLPEALPEDTYTISVGAYQQSSGDRLSVFAGDEERGDRLFLYDITVTHTDTNDTDTSD